MVLDILQWTYRKYKVYCFVTFILLSVCLLGYTALIVYWIQSLLHAVKVRKKHPPPPPLEELTASPARLRNAEPSGDEIMAEDDRPTSKIRVLKPSRRPLRQVAVGDLLTPSPLNERTLEKRKRRRRRSSRTLDFEGEGSVEMEKNDPQKRRLKLPPLGVPTRPPRRRGVSERLKNDRPTYKQYLFV